MAAIFAYFDSNAVRTQDDYPFTKNPSLIESCMKCLRKYMKKNEHEL